MDESRLNVETSDDPRSQRRFTQSRMKDLTNPNWIKLKGILFLLIGLLASLLLILEHPTWKIGVLLAVAIWCFCRFYYFAFYVIEHYVDPGYRFSGLGSFVAYLFRRRRETQPPTPVRPNGPTAVVTPHGSDKPEP